MYDTSNCIDWCATDTPLSWLHEVRFFGLKSELHDLFSDVNIEYSIPYLNSINIEFDLTRNDKYLSKLDPSLDQTDLLRMIDNRNVDNCQVTNLNQFQYSDNAINIMHLNIRSLINHYDELEVTLECIGNPIVIRLCEIWPKLDN